jgi:hypothetical protein
MATLQDLISRVRFYIDEPTAQNYTDAQITLAINFAQQVVAEEIVHEYEDYFEVQAQLNPTGTPPGTIAGTEFYNLPTDFLKFKRIERTDTFEPIRPIDQNEKLYGPYGIGGPTQGTPMYYYVTGNSVAFNPIPESAIPILMTYIQRLSDMVTTADVSAIPAEHHDLMAIRASIDMFINGEQDTSQLMSIWEEGLNRLTRTMRQRQVQEPKMVRRAAEHGLQF